MPLSDEEIQEQVEIIVDSFQELDLDEDQEIDEDDGQRLAVALVGRIFELTPGVREHFSDELIGELKEEISRDDTDFAAACRNAIMEVEQRWRGES